VKRYDHDPSRVDGLLAQKSWSGTGYFVTDALGSVYGVVDGSGAVVSKYGYDVYGARTAVAGGMATGWGFTGRRHDGAAEMYYRARDYDPTAGKWMAPDPAKYVDGPNRYQYVRGNPTQFGDPTGLVIANVDFVLEGAMGLVWATRIGRDLLQRAESSEILYHFRAQDLPPPGPGLTALGALGALASEQRRLEQFEWWTDCGRTFNVLVRLSLYGLGMTLEHYRIPSSYRNQSFAAAATLVHELGHIADIENDRNLKDLMLRDAQGLSVSLLTTLGLEMGTRLELNAESVEEAVTAELAQLYANGAGPPR
jgi:RHS repeat-associated protein